jgi:hypothetical protein
MQKIVSLAKPQTAAGMTPDEVVASGGFVRARPYYHVPDGPSSLKSTLSDWAYEVRVIEAWGEMVKVRFRETDSAPWRHEAVFFPKELHRSSCRCSACRSDIFTREDNERLCGAIAGSVGV